MTSPRSVSPRSYRSSSPDSRSSSYDEYSDVDELDRRSRKLTEILKKTVNKTVTHKSVLDVVRDKAWLLEDQVKLLQHNASKLRNSSKKRNRIVVVGITIVGFIFVVNKFVHNHVEQ